MHADQIEAIARALVAMLFPAMAAAMLEGLRYPDIVERAGADAAPGWRQAYGAAIADAAAATLAAVPPDAVLTDPGQRRWLALSPVGPIPDPYPVEAIAAHTPVEEIGGWRQFWREAFRVPAR